MYRYGIGKGKGKGKVGKKGRCGKDSCEARRLRSPGPAARVVTRVL